jgi:hypothetical protein
MAVRVLLVAAFTVLYGCGQASSPVEKQEKQGGVEQAAEGEEQPETVTPHPASELTTARAGGNIFGFLIYLYLVPCSRMKLTDRIGPDGLGTRVDHGVVDRHELAQLRGVILLHAVEGGVRQVVVATGDKVVEDAEVERT